MFRQFMLKRFIRPILGSLLVAWFLPVMSNSVFAQLPPPISPWMGMFDRNRTSGTLGPYLSNVRPQQDMMKAYAAQSSQIQAQQRVLQSLQSGTGSSGGSSGSMDLSGVLGGSSGSQNKELLQPPREIPSTQRNPAGYYQYLHYYPQHSLPRRPVPYFSSSGGRR